MQPTEPAARRPRREVIVAFSAIMLATLLAALDQTIVATALPRIAGDLGGFSHLSWVVTAYLLASTVTIPLYGKLSDIYGRRRLFLVAISLFLVGSALCGAARSVGELVAFRALQGLGAGGLLPLSQAAIGDLFSPRERGRYQGFVGAMWATAAVAGPLLGGVLTDNASWRWIFLLNIPLGTVALIVVARTMPATFRRREHRVDWLGALLLSVAVIGLLLGCIWGGTTFAWDSPQVATAALTGLVACGLFLVTERRAAEPLLPLELFRAPVPRVTAAGAAVVGALVLALTIYVPVLVQAVLGRSATASGTILIPLSLGWVVAAFVSGQLISRTGRYRIFPIVGGVLVLVGTVALAAGSTTASGARIAAILLVTGTGLGLTWPVYVVAIQNAVPVAQLGTATASLLFLRTMAGSVVVAVLGAVLNARLTAELQARLGRAARLVDTNRLTDGSGHLSARVAAATHAALAAALHTVFLFALPLGAALLALALALVELPLREQAPAGETT